MHNIKFSSQFKKDMRKVSKSGRKKSDLKKIQDVINALAIPEPLPVKNRDHQLTGSLHTYRECHILPDLLLVYQYVDETKDLLLFRIGSHSELF